MSAFALEDARQCQACGHQWFAEKRSKPQKPFGAGNLHAIGGSHGAAAASASAAAVKYRTKLESYNKWRYCPNCGSKQVKSVARKEFVPSNARAPRSQKRNSASSAPGGKRARETKVCPCGASLSPAWNFCPMCASPLH